MIKVYAAKRINTSATIPLVTGSTYVTSIVYNCSNAGTGWTLKIVERTGGKILIGPFPIIVPTDGKPSVLFELANDRVPMRGGVDAITAGTAGVLDIWLTGNRIEQFPV
jgi:hypothetical protein